MFKTSYGSYHIHHEANKEALEKYHIEGWSVVSNIFEIEVPLLSEGEIIANEVEAIDQVIKEVNQRYFDEISDLKQRKLSC